MNAAGKGGTENTPLFPAVLVPHLMESMPVDSAAGSGAAEEAREPLLDDGHGRHRPGRSIGGWTYLWFHVSLECECTLHCSNQSAAVQLNKPGVTVEAWESPSHAF